MLAGAAAACARRTDATLWCWGVNDVGQSGQGTFSATTSPAQVLTSVADLAPLSNGSGSAFVVVRQDGTLWAWGRNDNFVIGTGGFHDTPVQVLGGATWAR